MPAFRFFAPLMPLFCLFAAEALEAMGNRAMATSLLILTVIFNLLMLRFHPQIHPYIVEDKVAEEGKEVGMWLRENAPREALFATNTGGSIPYYSQLRTVDMLGLNDTHIAHREISWLGSGPAGHEKGDGAYVLSRKPDYIQFGSSLGDLVPRFLSDQELWKIPEFHREYQQKTHVLPSGKSLILYERRKNAP